MLVRSNQIFTVYHVHMPKAAWRPPTDVYETETEVVVQIEIAGMRDGHFHLSLNGRHLVIQGARSQAVSERRAYYQLEINSGDFQTQIELPSDVAAETELIRANYDDGFLRITLRKLI
jgi:HSP20 family molecular chaperone IbpA